MTDNDLPLLSNIGDIRARHYLIDLKPSFDQKVFYGKVIIFFEVTSPCEKKGNCCTRTCFCTESSDKLKILDSVKKADQCDDTIKTTLKVVDSEHEGRDSISDQINMHPDFELILDCCDLKVNCVSEILCSKETIDEYLDPYFQRCNKDDLESWSVREKLPLQFSLNQWSIKIVKPGVKSVCDFPQIVCIDYETSPEGKSVLWREDLDGKPCVFTPAASINNRSLLPCQDPPSAMATWQSWITVPEGFCVSITGDKSPLKYSCQLQESDSLIASGTVHDFEHASEKRFLDCFYYYTSMVLPIATIAIAIGNWKIKEIDVSIIDFDEGQKETSPSESSKIESHYCKHYEYPCHLNSQSWSNETNIRIVYPLSLVNDIEPFSNFLPFALSAATMLLGTYPCQRLEFVVLPRCFGSLGLASPNLIFISPTLIVNDSSAFIRLAHEISHAWYGINIGAKDWTEEWISEGFATYMEDIIFKEAFLAYQDTKEAHESFPNDKVFTQCNLEELSDLRAHLRYKTLDSELQNSSEDLQMLQPMQGEKLVAEGVNFVKDGLNPEKTFLQIHYLKGYFLLKFLRKTVGCHKFNSTIKDYVTHYHGQLVSTNDILEYFMRRCPEIGSKGMTIEILLENWFHQPGLNSEIKENYGEISNSLISDVKKQLQIWITINERYRSGSSKKICLELEPFVFSDQLVLLFEYMLELPKLHAKMLGMLFDQYNVENQNGDIRHRWCELAIKHSYHDLSEVVKFLNNDHSMGVYLYGELMISGKIKHKQLSRKLFSENKKEMDENARLTVQSMLYGN